MTIHCEKDLLDLVVAALLGPLTNAIPPIYATSAGANVFRPRDWPTQPGQYPLWKARVVRSLKQSLSRSGAPFFTVITTVRLVGEVSKPAKANDAGASDVEGALWQLAREGEIAVINSYPLTSSIQQILSVDEQLSYDASGEMHQGGIQIDLGIEWVQGGEDFAPVMLTDLDRVDITLPNQPPTGLIIALSQ